jgi:AcrR family transcriptional regulator
MATRTEPSAEPRTPLSKERVLRAAVDLADKGGIESLSMRKLAQELGVEAMSLYNHVRNKDDILDGVVDVVVGEIQIPPETSDWKTSLRQTVLSARAALLRHPWAPRVIESRKNPSPATFQYFESVIGILRKGGFSVDLTHHALHALGSRVLGFTQELFNDSDELASGPDAAAMYAQMAEKFPYMIEMAMAVSHEGGLGGCDDDVEFAFALDLILDGLERGRDAA